MNNKKPLASLGGWGKILLVVAILSVLIVSAIFIPLPVTYRTDFIMLYSATTGLVNGIGFYDYPAQVSLLTASLGGTITGIVIPHYVYPPWLAYSTFFLGKLSGDQAARLWFLINLLMVFGAVYLMTAGWAFRKQIVAYLLVFFFLPTLGFLTVGQYVAPVLLGTAMILSGAKAKSAGLIATGLVLISVKPQLGVVIFLVCVGWLLINREKWQLHALIYTLVSLTILTVLAFIIDPRWPESYLATLNGFRLLSTYGVCQICSSLSILLVQLAAGSSNTSLANGVGLGILLLIVVWFQVRPTRDRFNLQSLVIGSLFATLFCLPYLNNYDYVLLILPALLLVERLPDWRGLSIIALAFLLPWLGLLLGVRFGVVLGMAMSSVLLAFGMMLVDREFVDA